MNIEARRKIALGEIEQGEYGKASGILASIIDNDAQDTGAWIHFGFCQLFIPIYQRIDISTNPNLIVSSVFKYFYEGLSHLQSKADRIAWENEIIRVLATCLNDLRIRKRETSTAAKKLIDSSTNHFYWGILLQIFGVFRKNESLSSAFILNNSISNNYQNSDNFESLSKEYLRANTFYSEMMEELKDFSFNFIDNVSNDLSDNDVINFRLSLMNDEEKKVFIKKIKRQVNTTQVQYCSKIIQNILISNDEYQRLALNSQKHLKNKNYRQAIHSAKSAYDIHHEVQIQVLNEVELNSNVPNEILDYVLSTSRKRIAIRITVMSLIFILITTAILYVTFQHQHIHIYFSK